MRTAARLPMRPAARRATVVAAAHQLGRGPSSSRPLTVPSLGPSLAHWTCLPHSTRPGLGLTVRRLSSGTKPEEGAAAAAETSEEKSDAGEQASEQAPAEGGAAGSGEDAAEGDAEAPQGPIVLFRAPSLSKHFTESESMVNYSSFCCACGLGAALLGVAPFTPPNTFVFALGLAVVQVRLAHTWQTRVLRSQVRRHVEEIVQEKPGLIVIQNGGGLQRTLHLSSDAADSKPPLSEVLRHGSTFVYIDRKLGAVEAPEAFEAMLQSDDAIESEDLVVNTFEGEPQSEADKVVQPLSKVSAKALQHIGKQSSGDASPKVAIAQTARSASTLAGVILVVGGIIGVSGRRQADND